MSESHSLLKNHILTHLALHGMYHREQIMLLMRTLEKDVAATDYVLFLR